MKGEEGYENTKLVELYRVLLNLENYSVFAERERERWRMGQGHLQLALGGCRPGSGTGKEGGDAFLHIWKEFGMVEDVR